MPKQSTDQLMQLINSLTTSEKRHFKLFVSRKQTGENKLFVRLFDHLVAAKEYNEQKILQKIPGIKVRQLANLKANLYQQLLTSIRHVERKSKTDISFRENLDFAKLLYRKGLYKASLDMMDKAKKAAIHRYQYTTALSIIEFEKHIESQHITGSMYPKAKLLSQQSNQLLEKIHSTNQLSNLSLSLYGYYLQYGYVKTPKDYGFITDFFKNELKKVKQDNLDFYESLYLSQSYVWYYNMIQDFANNYRHAQKWVNLFHEYPEMVNWEPALYLKGLHNVLNSLFMLERPDKFNPVYNELLEVEQKKELLRYENEVALFALFKYIHGINKYFLSGQYDEGAKFVPELEVVLETNQYNWDLHRKLVFYYKIACIYFGNNESEKAILYLNNITNQIYPNFREDIQCYARILSLISHFDLGNTELVSYQIKSTYRFLLRMNEMQKVLHEIFRFLRKTPGILEIDLKHEFLELKESLKKLETDPYERRPFLYLDIISWLESKIEDTTIQKIIQRKKDLTYQN